MLVGKERHDIGRPLNVGYPVRAIRTPEYLYIHNYEPDRWPAGNPETGYRNVDDGPTKSFILSRFDETYRLCFGKRPREELYRVDQDPDCLRNLAGDPEHRAIKESLRDEMEAALRSEGDPRMMGMGWIFGHLRIRRQRRPLLRELAEVQPLTTIFRDDGRSARSRCRPGRRN